MIGAIECKKLIAKKDCQTNNKSMKSMKTYEYGWNGANDLYLYMKYMGIA